jgi:hypothetical protein
MVLLANLNPSLVLSTLVWFSPIKSNKIKSNQILTCSPPPLPPELSFPTFMKLNLASVDTDTGGADVERSMALLDHPLSFRSPK